VFLRLATCNLACSWCDTKYTWDWQHFSFEKEVALLNPEQVQERILGFGCPHLVITGGEPLLQQDELSPVVSALNRRGFYCEVETNGTIYPTPDLVRDISQWNVSPKLQNSGNATDRRELPQVLSAFCRLPHAFFKFVVVSPGDVAEVCALRDKYGLPGERIILMPEGRTQEVIKGRSPWVSEACVKEGFRFSTRLHILLWGDERGR
jgi:organic radical activating enzyme